MKKYWYTTCQNCHNQGRLFIMNNLTANHLYLHCGECESGWNDPLQIGNRDASFLTLENDDEAELATQEDIDKAGWRKYALNILEE